MNVIEIRNLSKKYSNSRNVEVMALRHVNLNIEKGRFVAIVGPSGSGKSTLLHLIGGLDMATVLAYYTYLSCGKKFGNIYSVHKRRFRCKLWCL